MKIDIRYVGGIAVLNCNGKLTLGEGTLALRNALRDLMKEEIKRIVLNMEGITYIDGSGVGEIVSSYTLVVNHGGQLKLSNLSRRAQDLLAISRLSTVFKTFADEEQAINSFFVC